MATLMSITTYAHSRGLSPSTVSRQVRSGRIRLVKGKIDPRLADRDRRDNLDPGKRPHPESGASSRKGKRQPANLEFNALRAQREFVALEKERIKLGLMEGRLLLRDEVVKALTDRIVAVRNRLLLLESKVPWKSQAAVSREVRAALTDLGNHRLRK